MSIARIAGQAAGAVADSATSVSKAYAGNVTSGNLLIIVGVKYSPSNDTFAAGDCTKSAGTATVGTITLDKVNNYNYSGSEYVTVGIWSVPVTGTGSCTMQVGGGVAGSYWIIGIEEVSGADTGASRVEGTNSNQNTSGAPDTGTVASAGGALFVGGLGTVTSGATTHTADGAFTLIYEQEDGSAHMTGSVIDMIVTTGTTDSASWTAPSGPQWAAALAVYKEASGAAATSLPLFPARMPAAILAR